MTSIERGSPLEPDDEEFGSIEERLEDQVDLIGDKDEPGIEEYCKICDSDTPHYVDVRIVEESEDEGKDLKFSKEPYRISQCYGCETVNAIRLNNA